MKQLGMLAAAVVFLVFLYLSKPVGLLRLTLPAEIRAIQCQPDARFREPGGVDVFHLADITLAIPCQRPGEGRSMAKHWESPANRSSSDNYTNYSFKKLPNGRFARTDDDVGVTHYAEVTRYAVGAEISLQDRRPIPVFSKQAWEMSVPTPPAFAATGPQTTFRCVDRKIHYQLPYLCYAKAQSGSVHWLIHVAFGKPVPEDFDMRPEVIEAYQMLAAHIVGSK